MNLRELMQWFSKLMPKQKMQDVGDGCVQAGQVGGNLNSIQTNHHAVYVFINGEQTQQPVNPVAATEPMERFFAPPPVLVPKAAQPTTDDQRFILRIIRHEPELGPLAERFMQKHFRTTYVKSLNEHQVYRVICYVKACANRGAVLEKKTA